MRATTTMLLASLVTLACTPNTSGDEDAGSSSRADAAIADASRPDAFADDASRTDAATADAGPRDAGSRDAAAHDAAITDAAITDAAFTDAAIADAATTDAASTDAGTSDASVADAGASSDAGPIDGGPWSDCPTLSDYVGGAWDTPLTVTGAATYCASFDEGRTLQEELDRKALLRLLPGDFRLDSTDGTRPFSLPMCLQFRGPGAPRMNGTGSLRTTSSTFDGKTYISWVYTQPMTTAGGEAWSFESYMTMTKPDVQSMTLDGEHVFADGVSRSYSLCKGDCMQWLDVRHFDSCTFSTVPLQRHTITFTGGNIELDLRIGQSFASTEPGLFVASRGTLDSVAFAQQDYWKLIYNPEHHHFTRHFIVLFDVPRANLCGIQVEGISPYEQDPAGTISLVDCNLTVVETRQNLGQTYQRF